MDRTKLTHALKRQLLREVARLYERDGSQWKLPIVQTIRELRDAGVRAVFFGGTLRSLLLSRLIQMKPGRPRDVDIVVAGATVDALKDRFQTYITRETRFGGLKLRRMNWDFDVWPLDRTWAFCNDNTEPGFARLPDTTFFNLEAIAVDVWTTPGKARALYSGNDQFFDGIITRTLEINREENPFPGLCVVRSLIMAASNDLAIGPGLAAYLTRNAHGMSLRDFQTIQREHYGRTRYTSDTMRKWLDYVVESHARSRDDRIKLPLSRQGTLWDDTGDPMSVHFRILQNVT